MQATLMPLNLHVMKILACLVCCLNVPCGENPMCFEMLAMLQASGDGLPDYPEDADIPPGSDRIAFAVKAADDIKAAGNAFFKQVTTV